jgi:hypothetical protein
MTNNQVTNQPSPQGQTPSLPLKLTHNTNFQQLPFKIDRRLLRFPPESSSQITVGAGSVKLVKYIIPNDHRWYGLLHWNFVAECINNTGRVNAILTFTADDAAVSVSGTYHFTWFNPSTLVSATTPGLPFGTSAAAMKTAVEALPNWNDGGIITFSSDPSSASPFTATFSGSLASYPVTTANLILNSGSLQSVGPITHGWVGTLTTPAEFIRFSDNMNNLIQIIRIRIGGSTPYENTDYGLKKSVEQYADSNKFMRENEGEDWGVFEDVVKRNSVGSGHQYSVILDLDLFEQAMPSNIIKSKFEIEITLQPANRVLETRTAGGESYSLSDLEMSVEFFDEPHGFIKGIRDGLRSGGTINIPYDIVRVEQQTIPALATVSNIRISDKVTSMRRIIHVMRPLNDLDDPTILDRLHNFRHSLVTSYQHKLNSVTIPQQAIDATGSAPQAFKQLMLSFGNHSHRGKGRSSGNTFKRGRFTNDSVSQIGKRPKFMMSWSFIAPVLKIEDEREGFGTQKSILQGANTALSNVSLNLEMRKTAVNEVLEISTITYSDAFLIIDSTGKISFNN